MKKKIIPRKTGHFLAAAFMALLLQTACTHYQPPITEPEAAAARIAGKIVQGALPAFEPGEDPAKNYFIVTPAYVIYFDFLQYENRELKLTVEKLRKIIEGRK
jgi:hypothetical protein